MTLLVVATVAGACLAVLAPPAPVTSPTPSMSLEDAASSRHSRFSATSLLGVPPLSQSSNSEAQFATLAFYLESTRISRLFAQRLRYDGDDPLFVSRLISVRTDPKTAIVTVRGFGESRQQAADVTNAFVLAVRDYISQIQDDSSEESLKNARASVDSLKRRIDKLGERIDKLEAKDETPSQTDPRVTVLQAQHDALVASYIAAYQRYSNISAGPAPVLVLTVLQPASAKGARPVSPSLIYSLPLRILLGLLLGLLSGGTLALLLERYGQRVTSRVGAEEVFQAPVLAEISKRGFATPVLAAETLSPANAEYRRLRATLLAGSAQHAPGEPARPAARADLARSTVPVESALADEPDSAQADPVAMSGVIPRPARPATRTRVAATADPDVIDVENRTVGIEAPLSGSLEGKHRGLNGSVAVPGTMPEDQAALAPVLVLATTADERSHPVVVAHVAANFAETGWEVVVVRLGHAAVNHNAPCLPGVPPSLTLQPTQLPGVWVGDWSPGDAATTATAAVDEARTRSDLVVVDVGRIESAEYAEVAPSADGLVVVCELGSTLRDTARHAADVIERSGARFHGVVLTQLPVSILDRLRGLRRRRSPLQPRAGSEAA